MAEPEVDVEEEILLFQGASRTTEEGYVRPRLRWLALIENIQRRSRGEGTGAISSRAVCVAAGTPREGGRHQCGLRARPTIGERDGEQALTDLRSCLPIKDLGEATFYLRCLKPTRYPTLEESTLSA